MKKPDNDLWTKIYKSTRDHVWLNTGNLTDKCILLYCSINSPAIPLFYVTNCFLVGRHNFSAPVYSQCRTYLVVMSRQVDIYQLLWLLWYAWAMIRTPRTERGRTSRYFTFELSTFLRQPCSLRNQLLICS